MRNYYLRYGLLLAVLAAGCRKNSSLNKAATNLTPVKSTGTGSKPAGGVPAGQLAGFKINGANCAFDSTSNAYYYPVPAGKPLVNFTVSFDTTLAKSVLIDNIKATNGAVINYSLSTNQQVVVKALDKLNAGANYNLVITGLPIVMLTAGSTIGDARISASFDLVDPDYEVQKSKLETSSKIMIAIRGATSRYYPKSSYAVHLVDDAGADADASLLGLRTDNSWILDAMYIDQARMRNRLSTDIWNSFNNVPYIASEPKALNGTRGYMTEVFLNNRYKGVYCLTEKLDRKQLQVKKQYGDMYKANFWTNESDFYGVSSYSNTSDTWGGWELAYPELGDTPAPDWGYLYNAIKFIATSTDEDFVSQIKNKVDINNMVDYFIFINIVEAPDNENKNTFFSFYDYRTAGNFFYSVWDLDGSMGRNAGGDRLSNKLILTNNNNLLDRLFTLNVGNFRGLLKTRWDAIKNTRLSKVAVSGRIEAYRQAMDGTNAFARERATWANVNQDLNTEAAYMSSWYSSQYDLFDNYMTNLK